MSDLLIIFSSRMNILASSSSSSIPSIYKVSAICMRCVVFKRLHQYEYDVRSRMFFFFLNDLLRSLSTYLSSSSDTDNLVDSDTYIHTYD